MSKVLIVICSVLMGFGYAGCAQSAQTKQSPIGEIVSDKDLMLVGVVTNLITLTEDRSGVNFKAFYLDLGANYIIKGDVACSEQTTSKLAIEKLGMKDYKDKKITIKGQVYCNETTGHYHIHEITEIKLIK